MGSRSHLTFGCTNHNTTLRTTSTLTRLRIGQPRLHISNLNDPLDPIVRSPRQFALTMWTECTVRSRRCALPSSSLGPAARLVATCSFSTRARTGRKSRYCHGLSGYCKIFTSKRSRAGQIYCPSASLTYRPNNPSTASSCRRSTTAPPGRHVE